MKYMIGADKHDIIFCTDCSYFVKMMSFQTKWSAFLVYLEELQRDKKTFTSFSLRLISRCANVKTDNLA